jgi:hypothetical protein
MITIRRSPSQAVPVADPERRPLSPAQRQTATELPWYRTWLLSTGRTEAEVDPAEVDPAQER